MAKPSKSAKSDRQAVVDKMLAQQRSAERSRGLLIVGVCVVIALGIVGAAAWKPIKNAIDKERYASRALSDIGIAKSKCQKLTTKEATGEQEHVEVGTPLDIKHFPPAFGKHYNVWEPIDKKFYSQADRPELGKMIHNLEHGYTIVWYDETVADDDDMMSELRAIGTKFGGESNYRNKVKIAPWTSKDGGDFPKGQHVAITHWSAGGVGDAATGTQVGVWQYCPAPSGEALENVMEKYPYMDSPEPNAI